MNYFLKYRFVLWTVVILLVMFLSVAGTMLYLRFSHPMPKDWDKRHGDGMKVWKELKLTPQQDTLFKTSRNDFFKVSKPIFDSLEAKRQKMLTELSKPNPDTVLLYALADQMGSLHTQMKRTTIVHLLKLRTYCSPEQVEILKKINGQLIRPEGPRKRNDNDHRQPEKKSGM